MIPTVSADTNTVIQLANSNIYSKTNQSAITTAFSFEIRGKMLGMTIWDDSSYLNVTVCYSVICFRIDSYQEYLQQMVRFNKGTKNAAWKILVKYYNSIDEDSFLWPFYFMYRNQNPQKKAFAFCFAENPKPFVYCSSFHFVHETTRREYNNTE